jgi:hypothetical protein
MRASAAREKLPRCRDGEAARSTRAAARCRSSRMRKQRALALLIALESIATAWAQPGLMFASLTIGHHFSRTF